MVLEALRGAALGRPEGIDTSQTSSPSCNCRRTCRSGWCRGRLREAVESVHGSGGRSAGVAALGAGLARAAGDLPLSSARGVRLPRHHRAWRGREIVIGGALASQGRISLASALAAGDPGRSGGRHGRLRGREALGQEDAPAPLASQSAGARKGGSLSASAHPGWAITLGRFPPGLRTFVPGAAGMSRVRYSSFILYNVLGAVIWGTTFVLLGYGAGRNWKRVETLVDAGGLVFARGHRARLLAGSLLPQGSARGSSRRVPAGQSHS